MIGFIKAVDDFVYSIISVIDRFENWANKKGDLD